MPMSSLNQIIDCSILSIDKINNSVKELISHNVKNVILKNAAKQENLLEGLAGNIKIEVFGNTGPFFANSINGPKITVNGDIANNSANDIKQGKITVFGSCGDNFGNNALSGEFYIFDNCGGNCFSNLTDSSNIVIGGQAGKNLGACINGSKIIILNLKGGTVFLDEGLKWFEGSKSNSIFIRGDINIKTSSFLLSKANEQDEDSYLPLISEFARLFKYSLSMIKSKPFYKVVLK